MLCEFVGGPLDGQTRKVNDDLMVYHYRPRKTVKRVPYYRSAAVKNVFFKDPQKAFVCSPTLFHSYS